MLIAEFCEKIFLSLLTVATAVDDEDDGERYLTDKEVSEILKVSRRTLQEYRNEGILPYIPLGGKVLYRESDLKELLEKHYHPAYRTMDK
mgnify:CR=1 FL=1